MKRIIKKPGDIFIVPLTGGKISYAQWLYDGTARFFLALHDKPVSVDDVLKLPVAFRVLVFNDSPSRYEWIKIGKTSVPESCSQPQHYARKDALSGKLYIHYEGIEKPATIEELKGLETAAVWAHPHIVERLESLLNGTESKYLRGVSIVA